ncbi:MAG: beta-propeller domain-containing protein [Clostridia bacterium]|nr:beta-propeller domain-containing protein [Clostridia bacterium]
MKKDNWFKALNLTDDKYLEEANPNAKIISISKKRIALSIIAAAACFVLVLGNLWLFIPFSSNPPDVSRYSDSEYYGIIQKLNVLTFKKPQHKNNFEVIKNNIFDLFSFNLKGEAIEDIFFQNNMMDGAAPESNMGGAKEELYESTDNTYEEITDNQVEGIVEADRIKRSDKHVYYLDNQTLRVFSIAGMNSKELGHIELYPNKNYYLSKWEFYLSNDCKTATVITQFYNENKQLCVGVVALDVSNPEKIVEKNRIEITGGYMSSRLTGGKLILLTEFVIQKQELDFGKESTFLPQINTGDGMKTIPASGIISPEKLSDTRYTVVMKLDEKSLNLEGTAAFLSYSEDVYVSKDNIFLTHVFADIKKDDNDNKVRNSMTEISCLGYSGNTFENKGSVTVRGYVKDQWSMDEYEGILRVVTTTNATTVYENRYSDGENVSADILVTATGQSNASLYCVDLNSFKVVAEVKDFAPPHEEVQSVRFDKNTAYVCTSIEMSDPVFFFDLSDLNNITYKDTGTIEGFSTSLINFGNGKLLGIGRANWSTFKVEIYEETADGVTSFCKYELQNAGYSTEYKSYYIDRKNQLIGLGINKYDSNDGERQKYIVLYFDGYNLVEVANVSLKGVSEFQRGVYIDGYMYMFGENDFKVQKIF